MIVWKSDRVMSIEIQANEGERSLPWDTYSHVFDLVRNGNHAFRESHFEQVRF